MFAVEDLARDAPLVEQALSSVKSGKRSRTVLRYTSSRTADIETEDALLDGVMMLRALDGVLLLDEVERVGADVASPSPHAPRVTSTKPYAVICQPRMNAPRGFRIDMGVGVLTFTPRRARRWHRRAVQAEVT